MKNQDKRFERLVVQATSMLSLSMENLRAKYADFPICIMKYIEKEIDDESIEVRFDNEEATILCLLDANNKCSFAHLFFDSENDEERFIDFLMETAEYNIRKSCWVLNDCHLKVKDAKDFTFFYFYK